MRAIESGPVQRRPGATPSPLRLLLEHMPTAVWLEDWSAVVEGLERLRLGGIRDPAEYVAGHPGVADTLVSSVVVNEVSARAVALFDTRDADGFAQLTSCGIANQRPLVCSEALAAWVRCETTVETDWSGRRRDGRSLWNRVTRVFPSPGECSTHVVAWARSYHADTREGTAEELAERQEQLAELVGRRTEDLARAHRQVADSESFLRMLADNLPGMVGYWDDQRICRFANRAYLEWFGRTPQEVIGRSIEELMGPELFALNRDHIEGACRGEPQHFERRLTKPSGEVGYTLAYYLPNVVAGRVAGFFATVTDVTPIKHAQASLEAANAQLEVQRDRAEAAQRQFERLFESSPDAIMVLDPSGRLLRANPATMRTFLLSSQDLAQLTIDDLFPPIPLASAEDGVVPADGVDSGFTRISGAGAVRGRRSDGTQLDVHLSVGGSLVDGAPVIAIAHDLTELSSAYRRLEQSNEILEQTTLAQQQFIYVVSHDLREPVNAIENFATLLREDHGGALDGTGLHYLDIVQRSAERIRLLLDDLLDFTRLESAERVLEPVDLEELLREIAGDMAAVQSASAASLSWSHLPVVKGHRVLLRVLLKNLVDNAMKFRSPDRPSQVAVEAIERADIVEIVVSDNGIGIEPVHLDRVFDMFRRLHSARAYPGTGMGLAMCKRIVQLHSGRIWATSCPDAGTQIHVTLPRAAVLTHGAQPHQTVSEGT